MEIVEQRIEISCELEIVQQFREFIEDVHIDNCKKSDCPIGAYSDKLKVIFDPMLDYDVCRNFYIKFFIESPGIFSPMFGSQKKGKENVKGITGSFLSRS